MFLECEAYARINNGLSVRNPALNFVCSLEVGVPALQSKSDGMSNMCCPVCFPIFTKLYNIIITVCTGTQVI